MNEIQTELVKKFFRYAAISSQSDAANPEVPSSEGQRVLADLLAQELSCLGFSEVSVNSHAVVQGKLAARLKQPRKVPAIGWVVHLDTVDVGLSPDIKPKLIENYAGGDICQNREAGLFIRQNEHPEILDYVGESLIVSDGTSVLGADDKAAIANVMTAFEILHNNPVIEHGDIYIAFVPDEEIGLRGAHYIDYTRFPVDYAFTIDCCKLGELVYETFNAGSAKLKIRGVSAHPMSAKNILLNPILVAVDLINLLDRGRTPEHTEGREGYIWVTDIHANSLDCEVVLNIRDHDRKKYEAKKKFLAAIVDLLKIKYPRAEIELAMTDVYANIADAVTPQNRKGIDSLYQAFRELGITPNTMAMRGGTDGSYISTRGILTANYFTGAHNFHSSAEFMPLNDVEKSVEVTLKLIELAIRA